MHMPDERVLMVMPAEQREIAARIAQCLHFANVLIRTADRLAKPRARSAHVTIQHIAMPRERSRTLHRIRRVCGHFAQAIVELLRRNMLERDRRNRQTVAIALAQLALHLLQPFDRFRRRRAIAVGIGQIPSARIRRVFCVGCQRFPSSGSIANSIAGFTSISNMLAIVGNTAIAVKRIIRIVAGIHHHHAHRNAPRPVGSLDRNRKRAWFERQRRRPGNGIHATGKLSVEVILFVGENAALEIVVAVGCGKGDSRFQCRSKECCERVSYFLPRAVEYGRGGRAIDGLRP